MSSTQKAQSAALLALDDCLSETTLAKQSLAVSNNIITKGIKLFCEALKDKYPDAQFTSNDISVWVKSYNTLVANNSLLLPEGVFNPYAIGRYLKTFHAEVGVKHIGSYGNRQVYALDTTMNQDE